jgi:hypothetical protein
MRCRPAPFCSPSLMVDSDPEQLVSFASSWAFGHVIKLALSRMWLTVAA